MSIKKEYLKALRDLKNKGFFDQKPQKYSLPTVSYVAEEKIKPLLESVPPLQHFIDNHLKKFTDFWGSEEQHGTAGRRSGREIFAGTRVVRRLRRPQRT